MWGFSLTRKVRWKNELSSLVPLPISRGIMLISQAATVVGSEAPDDGGRVLEIDQAVRHRGSDDRSRRGAGALERPARRGRARREVPADAEPGRGRHGQHRLRPGGGGRAAGQPHPFRSAERHAGLSQFAAPFLSRMKFVDEQGEDTSPTLSALRAYREHRAAGRRGLPPDASLDFAPEALQPLIRRNGVTDRRRWESALFLQVRDEIQTGNLAIEGAKNFGRFEAFFLPTAQWEQAREAFLGRAPDSPSIPTVAVERLKARLSDAFDRFLEGVADNRQVTFDDDGWRLKTDPAEQPDPAQSERLAELHRWLDARGRSIRLADLLIEVENDLRFSLHFQQPGERVDPGEVCVLLAAILAHGCNLGLYTMEKVAPDIAYRQLKHVSDWRLVEENQRAALAHGAPTDRNLAVGHVEVQLVADPGVPIALAVLLRAHIATGRQVVEHRRQAHGRLPVKAFADLGPLFALARPSPLALGWRGRLVGGAGSPLSGLRAPP